jgi:hypothetical protein
LYFTIVEDVKTKKKTWSQWLYGKQNSNRT